MSVSELAGKFVEKALEKGFSDVAIAIDVVDRVMVKFANTQPSVAQEWKTAVANIYLSKGRKVFTGIFQLDKIGDADKLLGEISLLVDRVSESELYAPLPQPGVRSGFYSRVDDKIVEAMKDPSGLVELLLEASSREHSIDFTAGKIDLWNRRRHLTTSTGAQIVEESTGVETYMRSFKEDGSGQWGFASRVLDRSRIEEVALKASELAYESRGRSSVEPGVYDVILSPLVFSQLMNVMAWMSTGLSVLTGMSIFIDKKIGDQVASPLLSIYDAPRDDKLPFSTVFDDEAVATFDKPIVEKGLLKNILHNTKTALKFNTESTGNAGWVHPRPWNLVIGGGGFKLEELISEVKRGLLVTNNWYTRLQNYAEGVFSTIGRDAIFLIESGRIVKPVERIRIADKLPRLLNNIEGLSRETYDVMWWEVRVPTRSPYALVRNVNITKHFA
ncbi:MAG: TldD/PmbA family protein [Thermogladius sp.]|jgi:PmbA protein|nr:TldD/PmbA family protein [Thermogladius sp.]